MDESAIQTEARVWDAESPNSEQTGSLKARLLTAIGAASPEEVSGMLDRLWSTGGFRVQRAPQAILVMVTVRDPFDTPFHLGEVLACEAEVAFGGHTGYGALCGDEPEKALLLATVEAVERSGRLSLLDGVGKWIARLEEKSAERLAAVSKLAAATAVRFESMKKETVDFGSLGG
jgi:alpha-D-ribose 1-methylphosphonate 5-triphosphate synthase subunit PhnG